MPKSRTSFIKNKLQKTDSIMQTVSLPKLLLLLRKIEFPHKLGILDRLFGKKISKHNNCFVTTAHGLKWKLDLTNPTHRWLIYGDYEGPHLRKWAEKNLHKNANIVVSGANIGQTIASLQPKLKFKNILAFEPNKSSADWLEQCLKANTHLPVKLIRAGLGSENSTARLVQTSFQGSQSFISDEFGDEIELKTLSQEWIADYEKIDLWILDVEGYEIHALKGAQKLFDESKINAIYMEVDSSEKSNEAVKFLHNMNFQSFEISPSGRLNPVNSITKHMNLLFLQN